MLTQAFQVMKMRGMDQRWKPDASRASSILNMRWDLRDGWTKSGGDRSIAQPVTAKDEVNPTSGQSGTLASSTTVDPFHNDGQEIVSLHWFAQHNGARQWLIWETADGSLRALWGPGVSTAGIYREGYPWKNLLIARLNEAPQQWDGVNNSRTILDTPNIRTQSVSWADRLYMVNGYDEPIVFDGTKTTRAGYAAAPSAPSANVVRYATMEAVSDGDDDFNYWTADLGLGMGTTGEQARMGKGSNHPLSRGDKWNLWRYKVSFVNERGQESPLSPDSNSVRAKCFREPDIKTYPSRRDDVVGRRFVTVHLPTGPTGTVARRVYRTQDMLDVRGRPVNVGEGSNYYFLHEIQDNLCESFEDGVPDNSLGAVVDPEDFGPWPTNVQMIASFKNTMFLAGTSDNRLKFSRPLNPEVYPINNFIEIGNSESGPITGLRGTKNALVVFKRKAVYLIKGDPEKGFYAETLTRDVGCCAANSIAEMPGKGTIFLSDSGVMLLVGALENEGHPTQVIHLSETIPEVIKTINFSAVSNAVGVYYQKDKEYWLCVPIVGGSENKRVMVYHTEIGEWSLRSGFNVGCIVETRDHRGYLLYGTNSIEKTSPGIRAYSLGSNALLNSDDVESTYITVDLDFGSRFTHITPAYVSVYAVGYGDTKLDVNLQVNRSENFSLTSDKQNVQQELLEPLSTFDSAKWGDGKWGFYRPICLRYDISTMHEGVVREIAFSFKAVGSVQLVGYELSGKLGEQRRIKPLTDVLGVNRR
jgi:hypothetical protein